MITFKLVDEVEELACNEVVVVRSAHVAQLERLHVVKRFDSLRWIRHQLHCSVVDQVVCAHRKQRQQL